VQEVPKPLQLREPWHLRNLEELNSIACTQHDLATIDGFSPFERHARERRAMELFVVLPTLMLECQTQIGTVTVQLPARTIDHQPFRP
jgi:hypothetical protein